MVDTRLLIALGFAIVAGCGGHSPGTNSITKIKGPDIKTLSHDQLMDVIHECHRYGSSDDPSVKYPIDYCSAAQSAHAMEGYSTPSSAVVDPNLNKMH